MGFGPLRASGFGLRASGWCSRRVPLAEALWPVCRDRSGWLDTLARGVSGSNDGFRPGPIRASAATSPPIIVPGTPTEQMETLQRSGGPVTAHIVAVATGPGDGFVVTAVEAESIDLAPLETDFMSRSHGTLLEGLDVFAGSVAGRELHVRSANGLLVVRLFAAKGHAYQVLAVRPVSAGGD